MSKRDSRDRIEQNFYVLSVVDLHTAMVTIAISGEQYWCGRKAFHRAGLTPNGHHIKESLFDQVVGSAMASRCAVRWQQRLHLLLLLLLLLTQSFDRILALD
jgi:hypothetical protein